MTEMNTLLERLKSRLELAEERINKCYERSKDIMQYEEQKRETMKKIEQNLKEMWDTITHINIYVMRIPKQFLKGKRKKI